MTPLAGRIWWSFYESDATFDNFVTRALAYVSGRGRDEIAVSLSPYQREIELVAHLSDYPYFVVLDGLERILVAYARMDAAHLTDEQFDEQPANCIAVPSGILGSTLANPLGRHRLRRTADVRVGQFLRKLSSIRCSRILVSSRLFPADLQTPMGEPISGCHPMPLRGLSDEDAIELWRAYGAKGSRGQEAGQVRYC